MRKSSRHASFFASRSGSRRLDEFYHGFTIDPICASADGPADGTKAERLLCAFLSPRGYQKLIEKAAQPPAG